MTLALVVALVTTDLAPRETGEAERTSCGWCIGAELGLSFFGLAAGTAIGVGVNTAAPSGGLNVPVFVGEALGLVGGSFLAASVSGLYDGRARWLGGFLGSLVGALVGGGISFGCWAFASDKRIGDPAAGAALLVAVLAALVIPATSVTAGIEIQRSNDHD